MSKTISFELGGRTYTFGLYAEGRDLFALVHEADVHPWYLERTRKLARICSLKADSNG